MPHRDIIVIGGSAGAMAALRRILVERMARDARSTGRSGIADLYETRAEEHKRHAGTLRQAVLAALD